MTLSDISIKNNVFAWMLMIGIIVFGIIAFLGLGVSQLPDVDYPVVSVEVTWEGAAPEVMETEVTNALESAVSGIEGIKEITSVSRQGDAVITLEFNLDRNIDVALQEVETKIVQAQKNLPHDIDPPIVTKTNPEDQPILWVSLTGEKDLVELIRYTNDYLLDQFTIVKGVGNIFVGGYVDPNLRVWLDANKMQKQDITVEDVLNSINSQHSDLPAGFLDKGPKETNLRVYGEASTPKEFENLIIQQRVRGGPIWNNIRIGDIGRVEDSLADIRKKAHSNGKTAIGLGIIKQRGTNAMEVANAVKQRITEVEKVLPAGMHLNVVFDTTKFIKASVDELRRNLILSVILTSIVCFLFLGSFGSTINVLLAIPTSLMGAFLILYFMDFTINVFTMLALSLVIGIIVDDAIMVLENIARHQEEGETRMDAAIHGAREITFAATAASFAILAIFVPVIFMKGVVGRFFFQFGITISVAVIFSLIEALSITPMRCSRFLDVGHTNWLGRNMDRFMKFLIAGYRSILTRLLKYPWTVLIVATAIFVSSLFTVNLLKKEFVPAQDQSRFLVRIMTPLGSSLEKTDAVFKEAEEYIFSRPETKAYFAVEGLTGQINQGFINISMKDREDRPIVNGHHVTQQEYMQDLRKKINAIPGIQRGIVQDLSLAGFTAQRGFPVEFTIRGPDWDKLGTLSAQVMKEMADTKSMVDIDTDYNEGMPELQIIPNRDAAAARGVSVLSISNTINAMFGGIRNGKYTSRGKRYDVRVKLLALESMNPGDISKVLVRNQQGEVVPLSEVVKFKDKASLFSITRKNRERAITLYANPAPGHSQQEALDNVLRIGKKVLPDNYHIVFSGGSQAFSESFQSLIFALILGIFVSYMVLATQFNSFIQPATVLLALPFSVTGAFLTLYLTHNSLNLYSMIGLILLMGIVKKNSILLVDFTNKRRESGLPVKDALLEACPLRLRPILMTSIATIAGALPPALAVGAGAETLVPMAICVIGGVSVSTLLTLFVVPCAYDLFSKLELKRKPVAVK